MRAQQPADLVVTGARIYTAQTPHRSAGAMAVTHGRIVFVGSARDAALWTGSGTQVLDLGGKRVLPGLFDSHIHPIDAVDFDVCDLRSRPQATLTKLASRRTSSSWIKISCVLRT
jgi:predicted amidohydrolase YtcJ